MLEELHVRDLALIEDVWLEFGPGMTVLTGETGAGKTALLGALKMLLGERADSGSVRGGASEASVEGRFTASGDEVIARRRLGVDGRSRCMLDSAMATVGALAERLGPLVDLHGQHEHQALLTVATHVGYLDRWAGLEAEQALAAYREARSLHREAVVELARVRQRIDEGAKNADYLRFVIEEVTRVEPRPGEDVLLEARLPSLKHAEQLSAAANDAVTSLRGDGGVADLIGNAEAALRKVAGVDPALDALAERLHEVETLADDIGTALRSYRDSVEHDPRALDDVMTRLGLLGGLMRKYGPTLDDVIAKRDECAAALAAVEDGEGVMREAVEAANAAEDTLRRAADRLSAVRAASAPGFVDALKAAAADLAMNGAVFQVGVESLPFDSWTADGSEKVEFLYSAAKNSPARPLAKIASGGEISRVMLALKSVLGEADSVETLVFDEVDAGIGGATAHAVGRRLAQLARTHQVIVVTHLAQVAAYADAQLVVSRGSSGGDESTSVVGVDGDDRVLELARMLSGNDSAASVAHARELLESAQGSVTAA
jgi:DNA repair protein RecN (Recombination protein N)